MWLAPPAYLIVILSANLSRLLEQFDTRLHNHSGDALPPTDEGVGFAWLLLQQLSHSLEQLPRWVYLPANR